MSVAKAKDEEYVLRQSGMPEKEARYWWIELRVRGMSAENADTLIAQARICAHDICQMLDNGCPPELAYEIHRD